MEEGDIVVLVYGKVVLEKAAVLQRDGEGVKWENALEYFLYEVVRRWDIFNEKSGLCITSEFLCRFGGNFDLDDFDFLGDLLNKVNDKFDDKEEDKVEDEDKRRILGWGTLW